MSSSQMSGSMFKPSFVWKDVSLSNNPTTTPYNITQSHPGTAEPTTKVSIFCVTDNKPSHMDIKHELRRAGTSINDAFKVFSEVIVGQDVQIQNLTQQNLDLAKEVFYLRSKLQVGHDRSEMTPPPTGVGNGPGFTILEAATPRTPNNSANVSPAKNIEAQHDQGGSSVMASPCSRLEARRSHNKQRQCGFAGHRPDDEQVSSRGVPDSQVSGCDHPCSQNGIQGSGRRSDSSRRSTRSMGFLHNILVDHPAGTRPCGEVSQRPQVATVPTKGTLSPPSISTGCRLTPHPSAESFIQHYQKSASDPVPFDNPYAGKSARASQTSTSEHYVTAESPARTHTASQVNDMKIGNDDDTISNASTELISNMNQENLPAADDASAGNATDQENIAPEFAERAGPLRELASKAEKDLWKTDWHQQGCPGTLNDFASHMRATVDSGPMSTRRMRVPRAPGMSLERVRSASSKGGEKIKRTDARSVSDSVLTRAQKRHFVEDSDAEDEGDHDSPTNVTKKLFTKPPGVTARQSVRRSSRSCGSMSTPTPTLRHTH